MNLTEQSKKQLSHDPDLIVSVSGGKDSTATCLHLFELGYTKDCITPVFMDTGWESDETYRYLNELENTIGKIKRIRLNLCIKNMPQMAQDFIYELEKDLGRESDFIRLAFREQMFPSGHFKFCTRHLKFRPLKKYFQTLENDWVDIIGVRRAESRARSNVEEWEFNKNLDCWVWRPIYKWTEKDVIDIHHRFGMMPNRMYLTGSHRVGCNPCIFARKGEFKILSKKRIDFIQKFEKLLGKYVKAHSNSEKVQYWQTYREDQFGFNFQPFNRKRNVPIAEVYKWAQGNPDPQLKLFDFPEEEPTCVKWGMCNV